MYSEVKYPFEKIKHILYKQAYRVHKLFPNKYEVDELVNVVWVKGNIQKLDCIKYISTRAYWDMMDYIRKNEGKPFMKKGVFYSRPKEITNMHTAHKETQLDYGVCDFFDIIESREKNGIDIISNKEEVDNFISCLSERKSNILRKYFLEEKTLEQIGKECKINKSIVCKTKKIALEEIRQEHLISA